MLGKHARCHSLREFESLRLRPQKIHSFGCDFLGRIGERTASLAKERFEGVLRYDLEIPIFKSSENRNETVSFESLRLRF